MKRDSCFYCGEAGPRFHYDGQYCRACTNGAEQTQTLLGGPEGPVEELGNCFPACLASMLQIPLRKVPHFYQLHYGKDGREQWMEILSWLNSLGWTMICWEWEPMNEFMHRTLKGALVIVSGQSPRMKCAHAVIGRLDGHGDWRLVHDPHPSRAGIVGDPTEIELLFKLVRPELRLAHV